MEFEEHVHSVYRNNYEDFVRVEAGEFSDWEYLFKVEDTDVYRRKRDGSALYEYMTMGFARDMDMHDFYEVLMDYDYMNDWHAFCKELEPLTSEWEGNVYRFLTKLPFVANREYIFYRKACRTTHKGKETYIIMSESTRDCTTTPPLKSKRVVRVPKHKQVIIAVHNEEDRLKPYIYMFYYDDPGGSLPSFLINWVAKTAAPQFLKDMRKAISKYDNWKAKNKEEGFCIPVPPFLHVDGTNVVEEVDEEELSETDEKEEERKKESHQRLHPHGSTHSLPVVDGLTYSTEGRVAIEYDNNNSEDAEDEEDAVDAQGNYVGYVASV
eukprot:m.82625 g.82625  ORF g.82625 m.82625 type:complete len:324 (-) comp12092_c1_seq5:509-1480(-)